MSRKNTFSIDDIVECKCFIKEGIKTKQISAVETLTIETNISPSKRKVDIVIDGEKWTELHIGDILESLETHSYWANIYPEDVQYKEFEVVSISKRGVPQLKRLMIKPGNERGDLYFPY